MPTSESRDLNGSLQAGVKVKLSRVRELETAEIRERRQKSGLGHRSDASLAGLSLSGGGVRSACFSLGLLEGLDRIPYSPPPEPLKAEGEGGAPSHLEYFDYVSSVSGGSYAAGHLATAMMPDGKEWLGKVQLTSKTVPGWLWGVGVWSLGVVFQLLKTGALLVGFLAILAFLMRIFDAPDARRFCRTLGLNTDVTRGFAPFWLVLGVFLTGYWVETTCKGRRYAWLISAWFSYAAAVVVAYCVVVWVYGGKYPDAVGTLPFSAHYSFLAALAAPVLAWAVVVLTASIVRCVGVRSGLMGGGPEAIRPPNGSDPKFREESQGLRSVLLVPLLTALFCLAALVTTGDLEFGFGADAVGATPTAAVPEAERWYNKVGDQLFAAACVALGVASVGLLFPRDLFKSIRRIEEAAAPTQARSWGWEPIFRVIVFLCSYGFVLLVVFVIFSMVAKEDVSGYLTWREELPGAALVPVDFRDSTAAWDRIACDAAEPHVGAGEVDPADDPVTWKPFAELLMKARAAADYPIQAEQALNAEIRSLESLSWIVRLAGPVLSRGLPSSWLVPTPWAVEGYQVEPSAARLYDRLTEQYTNDEGLTRQIADLVLSDAELYQKIPVAKEGSEQRKLDDLYRSRAIALAGVNQKDRAGPEYRAAVRANNRRALNLYLGPLMRDRRDGVAFASVVWWEDQWTRLRIAGVSGLIWLLCCAVGVNVFALQKFYRGHVIDCWVHTSGGGLWLYETGPFYRGWRAPEDALKGTPLRRAPLLLINATLEGNRSLGDEPDLPGHIFTFSPLSSGSGATRHWTRGEERENFARRNLLDVGNIVATSGAFLAPGTIANPALSAILHLLNIQTGYWVNDPDEFQRRSPWESLKFHACQSLGIDRDKDSRFMLTDGAHVENLGLYVLLQRRCSLIVVSDCGQGEGGASAERRFDALVQVLQQAGVDGIQVGPFLNSTAYRAWLEDRSIPARGGAHERCERTGCVGLDLLLPREVHEASHGRDTEASAESNGLASANGKASGRPANGGAGKSAAPPAARHAQEHFVFAQIHYPGGSKGLLVYVRPTLTGDEGDGLLLAARSSAFPDDDPVDQFYTPAKMSLYRLLGRHIASELAHDPVVRAALDQVVRGVPVDGAPSVAGTAGECDACTSATKSCYWRHPRSFRTCP